jgi:hypothetical protein
MDISLLTMMQGNDHVLENYMDEIEAAFQSLPY